MNSSRMRIKPLLNSLLKIVFILPAMVFSSFAVHAADLDLETDLHGKVENSKKIVKAARVKQQSGSATLEEAQLLRSLAEDITSSDMLVMERLKVRERKVINLNSKAMKRHQGAAGGYAKALKQYLSLISTIPANGSIPIRTLNKLETLLEKIVRKKSRPIIGSLPYKQLNYAAKEPIMSPTVVPAYRGGNNTANSEDTQAAVEAPISLEIATLAQALEWNPVLIYEYVKNNIETEWYFGCMKGAEDTLHQKSGNDCDQATLLTALLRASGYPTRYVRGTIEFFPNIEKAKNLTGVSDPAKLGEFFQKAGIPFHVELDGAVIKNIQIDHIYVETFVPYSNYRGAIMDEQGKVWLALDTSIKAGGYAENQTGDILSEMSFSGMRDDYLSAVQTGTPLEYLTARVNEHLLQTNPTKTYIDYLSTRMLNSQVMQILPSSLQFKEIAITGEYATIPSELIHKVNFSATDSGNNELFNITLDAFKLSNHKIIISYEPETVDDQEIINSFGGLDNTPAYLVRLRPALMLNDERIAVGTHGVAMGGDYDLFISVVSPNGTETVTNSMIAGNMTVIGVVGQKAILPTMLDDTVAANLLYREALRYIDNWNKSENELAQFLKVSLSRPVPTVATLANIIDVTYLLDQPQGFEWKGLFLDADLKAVEAVNRTLTPDNRTLIFTQFSALQGSVLESKLFEDAFGVGSISTAKLIGLANGTQPATPVLTIDQSNIAAILPTLPFDDNVKQDITEAVASNFAIRIPQSEIIYEDWTGIGYIKENLVTGEAGYMLSGMVAGGMTAWSIIRWSDLISMCFMYPYSDAPVVNDPQAAFFIEKIRGTDLQAGGKVGAQTIQPLQVVVRANDEKRSLVSGADVTFTIKAGGGLFSAGTNTPITVKTNERGIASIGIILGELTSANPRYLQKTGDDYQTIVGENIIEASLSTGTSLQQPFTELAFPDVPAAITSSGGGQNSYILSYYGAIFVFVTDRYGNPVSNVPVNFEALEATPLRAEVVLDDPDMIYAQLTKDSSCADKIPVWDECGSTADRRLDAIKTDADGRVNIGVILGGVDNADYPIKATLDSGGSLSTTIATHTARMWYSVCGTTAGEPFEPFNLYLFSEVDAGGRVIEARPANTIASISAKVTWFREGKSSVMHNYACQDGQHTCADTTGDCHIKIQDPVGITVKVNDQVGSEKGNGIFEANVLVPLGHNLIEIEAKTIELQNYSGVVSGCSMNSPYDSYCFLSQWSSWLVDTKYTFVYGVAIQMPPAVTIVTDADGYAVRDTNITYSILPSNYTAATAQFLIYRNDDLVTVIQTDKTGSPTTTIARGYQFDQGAAYSVQVVLNYGYRSEIWGAKIPLMLVNGYLKILSVSTPCESLASPYTCANSFIAKRNLAGDEITVTGEAIQGAMDISAQITWTCESAPGALIDGGVCESLGNTGATFTFVPHPPPADTGRTAPLAYKITAKATINGTQQEEYEVLIQDPLDELRQEYEDLNRQNVATGKYGAPDRNGFDQNPAAYDGLLGTSAEQTKHTNWHILESLNPHAIATDSTYTTGNLNVTSGYRCPVGNQTLVGPSASGGALNSNHQYGKAFDFDQKDSSNNPDSGENYKAFQAARYKDAKVDSYLKATKNGSPILFYRWDRLPPPPLPDQLPEGYIYVQGHVSWQ